MNSTVLNPSWNGLVVKPMIPTITIGVILSVIVGVFLPALFLAPLVFFLAVAGLQYVWNRKKYEKTKYELGEEKIRAQTGTYFSDSDTELLWSKIVQPRFRQGFIQKLLFGTVTIALDTAGQRGAEVVLAEMDADSGVFKSILDRLDEEVVLADDQCRQEYQPAGSGKWLDSTLPMFVLTVLAGGGAYGGMLAVGIGADAVIAYTLLAISAVLLLILPFSLYGFLKQSNTTYKLYEHYAVLDVDFLGRTQKVIPLSQLSDVNLDQPIHKRLIGLSNLGLSVPGMGDAFVLENIASADGIRDTIKQQVRERSGNGEEPAEDATRYEAGPAFTATVGPSLLFTVFGLLISFGLIGLLPIASTNAVALGISTVPAILPGLFLLYRLIRYSAVDFVVEGDRVEYDFAFLSRDMTSLSTDKIKAIVKSQGILQRLFNVYTVSFHSIGTEDDVDFFNLEASDRNDRMIEAIREREGSAGGDRQETVRSTFSLAGLLFQNPAVLLVPPLVTLVPGIVLGLTYLVPLFWGVLGGVTVTTGLILAWFGYLNFYYSNCVSLELYTDYLVFREGYFYTKEHYVIYGDIRNVEYSEQPFGSVGWLTIDFAGGAARTNDDGDTVSVGGVFTVPHLADVTRIARNLENIFAGKLEPEQAQADREEQELDYREELKQTIKPIHLPYVLQGFFYGLVIPFFMAGDIPGLYVMYGSVALAPLGALGGFIYPKTISYSIKENQVESSQWLLVTRTKSVKYQNIDNIDKDRGFTDKIFGTGRVNVSTTGGGGVEFQARFIKDYDHFYETLQAEYNEARTDDQ